MLTRMGRVCYNRPYDWPQRTPRAQKYEIRIFVPSLLTWRTCHAIILAVSRENAMLGVHGLPEDCGSVLSGSVTQRRVYPETT